MKALTSGVAGPVGVAASRDCGCSPRLGGGVSSASSRLMVEASESDSRLPMPGSERRRPHIVNFSCKEKQT